MNNPNQAPSASDTDPIEELDGWDLNNGAGDPADDEPDLNGVNVLPQQGAGEAITNVDTFAVPDEAGNSSEQEAGLDLGSANLNDNAADFGDPENAQGFVTNQAGQTEESSLDQFAQDLEKA
jgi:hypothetical protein